ncbi:Ribosomal protein L11 methyltransferase [Candidatus Terasakiella magnetica]|uniref:Ribosomal protein L11 methyltransferase n=1 Tax=Candidatus Terasakiella magnetica TaxID=1867952 RepID=A0A1C3RKE0_9PROT|nr:50S ribosomal protein L11 methyltransferase [Candidatus Terasakiella magnetica]SCA57782.1 Ribosomal protein L11 methyltransferase [Candidatus Terasakiella magnetica]
MSDILWRVDVAVTPELADAFEYALEDYCAAVTQYLDDDELAQRLEAYADVKPDEAALRASVGLVAKRMGVEVPEVTITEVENKDWLAEYARKYPPLSIGRYFIYGSHFQGPLPAGKIALKVEAATAFGTGEHASTNGCLQALDRLSKRYKFSQPLDMGCGSAILAMAIAKTWSAPVVASDIDAQSVDVAKYNAEVNGVGSYILPVCGDGYGTPSVARNGPYDLIMANILARPLSAMAKDLAKNLQPGGFAVLAGFLERDANWVFAAHRCHGLRLVERIKVDGWQTLVLRKG